MKVFSNQLPVISDVTLAIYNVLGQKIATLVNAPQNAGSYQVRWNGRDQSGKKVGSGLYFYRLYSGKQAVAERKMLLMK